MKDLGKNILLGFLALVAIVGIALLLCGIAGCAQIQRPPLPRAPAPSPDPARYFVLTTSGRSMLPTLPIEPTPIQLERVRFDELRRLDVVVFQRKDGGRTTHRLFKKMPDGSWWTRGDNNHFADDEYCTPDNLVGRVIAILAK